MWQVEESGIAIQFVSRENAMLEKGAWNIISPHCFAGSKPWNAPEPILNFYLKIQVLIKTGALTVNVITLKPSEKAIFTPDLFPGGKAHEQTGLERIRMTLKAAPCPSWAVHVVLFLSGITLLTSLLLSKVCASDENTDPPVSNVNTARQWLRYTGPHKSKRPAEVWGAFSIPSGTWLNLEADIVICASTWTQVSDLFPDQRCPTSENIQQDKWAENYFHVLTLKTLSCERGDTIIRNHCHQV